MSYRRALLTRWSRRDRLAVLVIAVAVAFLTGTTLVVLAVGSSTASIAAQFSVGATVTEHPSVADAEAAAGPDAIVAPLATVNTETGTTTVVGVPMNASMAGTTFRSEGKASRGTLDSPQQVTLQGESGSASLRVRPRGRSPFPSDWIVTNRATVETLGTSGALVIAPAAGVPAEGVPLQGALAFFLAGTRSALTTLVVAAGVGAVLVGVTVYSVTRMTVRDRVRELFVLRATGHTRWQVRRLFLSRGVLLLGIGIALGYALGVIVTNIAVNVAIAIGLPTSLSTRVTGEGARFLAATYGGVFAVGIGATLVAVQPELGKPPAEMESSAATYRLSGLRPQLLSERTAIPTAATLAAFVTFLLVVAGMASVAGPLAATDAATITEPGSTHPIASGVPVEYAEPLRNRGIAASPEILLFAVRDGQPFPVRGANYPAFAEIRDAQLIRGRTPTANHEAVIGAGLADTLDVEVGETLLVGGSVRPAVTRVHIVGAFTATGSDDDQLVVSLDTGRHLSTVPEGQVNFIRAERLPPESTGEEPDPTVVTDLTAPSTVQAGDQLSVQLTLRNDGLTAQTIGTSVRFEGREKRAEARVPANSERTVTITFATDEPGEASVAAGSLDQPVTVLARNSIRLTGVPDRAPPGSRRLIRVLGADGRGVEGVRVTAENWTGQTAADGTVRVTFDDPGETEIRATRGEQTADAVVTVTPSASRTLETGLRVTPRQPSLFMEPRLRISLSNRWAESQSRSLTITAPEGPYQRSVVVPPGQTRELDIGLPQQPPGRYDVTVMANGSELASTRYEVTGDDRIVSALATSGRTGTTGIGQAVAVALGNLELAMGALIFLGAGMTIGGAAATFAGAVHANRGIIGLHRAVGATRWQIGRLVFGDALRLGSLAIVMAIVVGLLAVELLDWLGLLTIYGVKITTTPSPLLLMGVAAASLVVVCAGAAVAAVSVLAKQPAELVDIDNRL